MMFPCVSCGYLTISEAPGSFEICEICFWEDDPIQLKHPTLSGGANGVSLIEAQQSFAATGSAEKRTAKYVRAVTATDERDPQWRPIDLEHDRFVEFPVVKNQSAGMSYFLAFDDDEAPEGEGEAAGDGLDPTTDGTDLYWWRPTYRYAVTDEI